MRQKKSSAKVLAMSQNPYNGIVLTTMELEYPRFIHAEFMTHRVFSRNASSSRAIPIGKQIDMVERYPVFPLEWGRNQPGMQARERVDQSTEMAGKETWNLALTNAVKAARALKDLGVHKQIANRLLEPFSWIKVIVTSTEWTNFFDLRISSEAQPEIRDLAEKMLEALDSSEAETVDPKSYHAPYLTQEERRSLSLIDAMKVSAARCARVSYLNHEGLEPDLNKDLDLANRLYKDRHASVFEHQARPVDSPRGSFVRNLRGWSSLRSELGI